MLKSKERTLKKQFIAIFIIGTLGLSMHGCGETDSHKKMKEDAKNWENPNSGKSNSSFKFPTSLRKDIDIDAQDARTKILKSLSIERAKGVTIDGSLKKDERELSDLINSILSELLNDTVQYQKNNNKEVSWSDKGVENFYALKQISSQTLTNRDTQFKLVFRFGDDLDLENYIQKYWTNYYDELSYSQKLKHFNDEYQKNLVCGVSDIYTLKEPFTYEEKYIDKGFLLTCGNFFKMN